MYVIKNVSFHLGFFLFQNVNYFLDSPRKMAVSFQELTEFWW